MRWVPGIDYLPAFLARDEAAQLCSVLEQELSWRQQAIVLFGKRVMQPRLTAWSSDPGITYAYSGLRLQPAPWHPAVAAIRARLKSELGLPFNSMLANAYRDGRDSMGWHADDEPELGARPVVASLSLGATRRFRVRPRPGAPPGQQPAGIDLAPGSLLLMGESCQSRWQHCLPRTAKPVGLRINLTFRRVFAER
ncbi:MAG: alpha-ketoglutarate-dependent dioxygenase AlkB [Xanthomonadales bacterium]|nr:alpha-ketoglutarate-dependent dioxygenase AlkB [Xanthomonadales bacterium]